ncbi:hypothetical protein BASA61_003145 [Batrachochytrium salamandrivorans]|nr:hypothetical protein BASA62_000036 [Batrachochytrium salamandrivorans]KAH6578546.1 hypothetical protein BASA60_003611 [Batrachochytrium salamandrivorans]KAH6597576.1 hypothetical protein BASA61_003145 [Batrachochytrium salamandrivorans]KAH9248198.1 hypothetical protein BASA81_014158 [Batrachochytrium salamandrivorans]
MQQQMEIETEIEAQPATSDIVEIVMETINHNSLVQQVQADSAGAISLFLGTTRNTFTDATGITRQVKMLSYEAYIPMALKEMQSIAATARSLYTSIVRTAIVHRLGHVAVGEASIAVVVSSPHRRDAIEAVAWIMDEIKATVPIWKMEVYTDGSMWKENAEWQKSQRTRTGPRQPCCSNSSYRPVFTDTSTAAISTSASTDTPTTTTSMPFVKAFPAL